MHSRFRSIATAQLLLITPAVLFLAAVLVQTFGPAQYAAAGVAHVVVAWYAARMWTLWVLLLAFPLAVLCAGGAVLWPHAAGRSRIAELLPLPNALRAIAATTVVAGAVLFVVVLHMAAN